MHALEFKFQLNKGTLLCHHKEMRHSRVQLVKYIPEGPLAAECRGHTLLAKLLSSLPSFSKAKADWKLNQLSAWSPELQYPCS